MSQDSKPKCRILPSPLTKIHQVRYVTIAPENEGSVDVLALSTEDGRIIFYSTTSGSDSVPDGKGSEVPIPNCRALGQMGGRTAGLPGRVKDFEFLRLPAKEGLPGKFLMVSGSSDGAIRVWTLAKEDFDPRSYSITASTNGNIQNPLKKNDEEAAMVEGTSVAARQTGRLIGTYETGNRITCLKAFVMIGTPGQDNSVSEPKEPNNVKEDVESSDGSGSG